VPVEADLMAAKQMLADMDGKIENALRAVATERVEVRRLEELYVKREGDLTTKRDQLLAMRESIKTQPAASKPGEFELQKARLAQAWSGYEVLENLQKTESRILEGRRKGLVSAETKVANLKTAQIDLKGRIEALEARRKMLEAEKVAANVAVDDSEIAGIKNLVSDIEKKLDVEVEVQKELDTLKSAKPAPEAASHNDIVEQIDKKFGKSSAKTGGTSL
jgi:4-hydroxy-L-threonine phosphate dehydrogenase PdxA